jgi:CubicO group peptidase (beta-lactamase class C family)
MPSKYLRKLFYRGIIVILVFLLAGMPSFAQKNLPTELEILNRHPEQVTEPQPPVQPSPTAPGLNNSQEFEDFVDNFFEQEMSKNHIPGGVVSVVKDGKLFFAKGYGYANVEKKIPVVADQTLFRVASLSKLVTATAAMQLYERGQLDLNADVNQYLSDFQLKNPFPQPVKVAQLMTHTDGTTKRRIGLAARSASQMKPLGEYLAQYMPPIVWQPGELYSYSSHSTALLGYLVEKIFGIPFVRYIDKNIFQPLEMRRSTFLQPPPPQVADDLAVGYQYRSNSFQSVPYLYLNIAPAASMQTTATDMANFMIAHLLRGRYENSRILEEDTVRLMHEQHFTHHPLLPGSAYEFHERLENNLRMLSHIGSLRGYSSSLTLLPDRNIGIFTATNSFASIHGKLITQFLDRYFPAPKQPDPKPISLTDEQWSRVTGTYRDVEYPRHTFAKLSAPFEHIDIKKGNNNRLLIQTPKLFFLNNPSNIELVPVEPLLFQRVDDDRLTAFGEDTIGRIGFAYNPLWPVIGAYERVPWYETAWVQLGIAAFCVTFFLSASIVWPILPLIRRMRGKRFRVERRVSRAWILAGLVGILNLIFLIGLPLSLWLYGVWKLVYGVPVFAIAFLCLPLLTTILTVALLLNAVQSWRNKYWSLMARSHYSLIALAAVIFIPFLAYWNLLGFQF